MIYTWKIFDIINGLILVIIDAIVDRLFFWGYSLSSCFFLQWQLFVFGSFTEDETRSWLQSQSSGSVKKPISSGRAEKPAEDKELQFGSLNFGNGSSLAGTTGELNGKSAVANGPFVIQPSTTLKKDDKVMSVKALNDNYLGAVGFPKENGHIKNSTNGPAFSNGVKHLRADGIDFTSLHQNAGHAHRSPTSKFHVLYDGSIDDRDQNGAACNSSISGSKEVSMKAIIEPVKSVKDLLPRGLINSGNLCFLNATLQALLSCSPFVQLLQELRTRDIPKVCLF